MPRVPAYFDAFLEAIAGGADIGHVHLGYWDAPDGVGPARARAGFAQAQDRLGERLVAMLDLSPGDRLLDVGCGFGGVLEAVRRRHPGVRALGVNVDPRQLAVALRRACAPENAAWVAADACALPFPEGAFDRLLCVEAAFHFPSRLGFFAQAHRVLARGGVLVMSDIVLARPDLPDRDVARIADRLEAAFGPWPAKWASFEAIARDAARAGFALSVVDATANTWPSYHTIAPEDREGASGGAVLRDLHRAGCLRYLHMRLDRRERAPEPP